jgi:hypothetical protein
MAVELDGAFIDVEAIHISQQHVAIWLPRNNRSQRRRDIRRRKTAGGDLVEQRLEQMKVAAIDQRNLHVGTPQRPCCIQSAEAAADDYNAMLRRFGHPFLAFHYSGNG